MTRQASGTDGAPCQGCTAKTHVSRLLAKLEARDRAQLVIAAYEAGLVGGPDAGRPGGPDAA